MSIIESLISVIAPHVCIRCGVEGDIVCAWCLPDSAPALPERCYRCHVQTDESRVCKRCRRDSHLKHVWVRTGYEKDAKQLIHDFKFSRKRSAFVPIARLATETVPYVPRDTLVTHIPTATGRIRRRGYDHAELLAKESARLLGLRFERLLCRSGQARQVGASRTERLRQLNDAFSTISRERISGSPILLVDDLVTTGGTLEAAARCLRRAGAVSVDAVVFAQK